MPLSFRLRRRLIQHHSVLALACSGASLLIALPLLDGSAAYRWSMATAYVGLILLAMTLSVGVWQVIRAGRAPLSSDLRRDLGIWTAIVGLVHVGVGLQVHMGSMLLYFFVRNSSGAWMPRVDPFGLGNWAGLGAALVLMLLLCLSNDWSLRRLGRSRWKALQRGAYACAVLVVLHGVVYQLLERRVAAGVVIFALTVGTVLVLQFIGFRRQRALS